MTRLDIEYMVDNDVPLYFLLKIRQSRTIDLYESAFPPNRLAKYEKTRQPASRAWNAANQYHFWQNAIGLYRPMF